MKRLSEMSRTELLSMTDTEFAALADLECAFVGIPLLPPEPEKAAFTYPERDITVYTVDGYNFTDFEEAQRYCAYVNDLQSVVDLDYDYSAGLGSDFKYLKRQSYGDTRLEKRQVYSADAYAMLKSKLRGIKAQEEAYKEKMNAYTDALNSRREIENQIRDSINDARRAQEREDMLIEAFKKYHTLTNDAEIAQKLVIDAYKVTDEEAQTIKQLAA